MTYAELRKKHKAEIDAFPLAAAFNDKQFGEALQKLGVSSARELVHIGGGILIRKADRTMFYEMLERHERELKEALKDDRILYEALGYEMANHEYCVTEDIEDTLDALGIDYEEFSTNARMQRVFVKCRKDYMKSAVY